MHYTRVLGTVGLIGATVLGAMGPSAVSHAASANTTSTTRSSGSGTSVVTAVQRYYQALSTGYVHTSSGGLGTPLSEQYRQESHISGGLSSTVNGRVGAASAAHSSALAAATQPNLSGSTRTNQDFGFYNTGNGALYHNNESVATDPNDALHVVVAGADTRLGSDSSIFVYSSGSAANARGNACLSNPTSTSFDINLSVAPCGLIDTLGGPGIYDSIDGAKSFTDLIIPDALSGAVPDAIITDSTAYGKVGTTAAFVFGNPYPGGTFTPGVPVTGFATVGSNVAIAGNTSIADTNTVANGGPFVSARAAIGCIAGGGGANGIVGGVGGVGSVNQFNQPGFPNGCLPYDSVGNQTVAFDRAGNLYSVALGLIASNPIVGAGPQGANGGLGNGQTGLPQTDVLLNVSPAIQPIGQLGGAPSNGAAYVQTAPPYAAGRVFNATPPYIPTVTAGAITQLGCDPGQSSTTVCLHNEVIVTNTQTNMVNGGDATSDLAAQKVGRNYRADAAGAAADPGPGLCGTIHFCIIDTPALAVDNVIDSKAFVTYTVIDFNTTTGTTPTNLATSNIYLTTATVPDMLNTAYTGDPGYSGGTLPKWTPPVRVDNSASNPYCIGTSRLCTSSYAATTAIGPDGASYIAYLNDDPGNTNFFATPPSAAFGRTALLVAQVNPNQTSIGNTALAAFVENHDAYNAANSLQPQDPAGLDPSSGAYFTIANRPTIAVSEGVLNFNGKNYPGGLVIVAWTDQRSLSGGTVSFNRGTRILYTVGAAKSSSPLVFNVIGTGTGSFPTAVPLPLTVPGTAVTGSSFIGATTTGSVSTGATYGSTPGNTYSVAEIYEPGPTITSANPGGFVNQFFPAIVADQSATTTLFDSVFVGFYQETPGTVTFSGNDNLFSSSATLAFLVGKSTDFGNTFGIQQANVLMPLPNPPLSPAYCSYQFGFQYGTSYVRPGVVLVPGAPFASNGVAASACNAVPYFGNGIGASAGSTDTASNDAYFAFTNTQADSRDFNVQGSQNIYTLHAS